MASSEAKETAISVLTVSNRPIFWNWIQWNIEKQIFSNFEWIVIDTCENSTLKTSLPSTRIFHLPLDRSRDLTGIARNFALRQAKGKYICWMDDDDWQHPFKLALLFQLIEAKNYDVAGWSNGIFFDPWIYRCKEYKSSYPWYLNTIYRNDIAKYYLFDDKRAPDSRWNMNIVKDKRFKILNTKESIMHSLWLVHPFNTSKRDKSDMNKDFSFILDKVDRYSWNETEKKLEELKYSIDQYESKTALKL